MNSLKSEATLSFVEWMKNENGRYYRNKGSMFYENNWMADFISDVLSDPWIPEDNRYISWADYVGSTFGMKRGSLTFSSDIGAVAGFHTAWRKYSKEQYIVEDESHLINGWHCYLFCSNSKDVGHLPIVNVEPLSVDYNNDHMVARLMSAAAAMQLYVPDHDMAPILYYEIHSFYVTVKKDERYDVESAFIWQSPSGTVVVSPTALPELTMLEDEMKQDFAKL